MPANRKLGKNTRRPAWINEELLDKVKHKKKAYEAGSKDGQPGRKTERSSKQPGIRLGRLKTR